MRYCPTCGKHRVPRVGNWDGSTGGTYGFHTCYTSGGTACLTDELDAWITSYLMWFNGAIRHVDPDAYERLRGCVYVNNTLSREQLLETREHLVWLMDHGP